MILISQSETDPFFNIATEEFLLQHAPDGLIIIWQNKPSVIVGKHQNTFAEVNLDFVKKNKIPVIRRISGGGTVFHDLGNINFSMITTEKNSERLIDFKKFTEPVIHFLKTLGVEATFEGKNNLVVNGKKISGNSAHVMKNRILHHGTLLFNTNLENLENSILPPKANISDKAVKSIRATVTNISEELNNNIPVDEFRKRFQQYLKGYFQVKQVYTLSGNEKQEIEILTNNKYRKWEWNYGYSPAYEVSNKIEINEQHISASIQVKNGLISSVSVSFSGNEKLSYELSAILLGTRHSKETVKTKLKEINHIFEKYNLDLNEIIKLFF